MDISHKIQVTTITIAKVMIIENELMIALLLLAMQKSFPFIEVFVCLVYSLIPIFGYCGCTELVSSVTKQNNSWYATTLLEKPTIWWKMHNEINRWHTHTEAQVVHWKLETTWHKQNLKGTYHHAALLHCIKKTPLYGISPDLSLSALVLWTVTAMSLRMHYRIIQISMITIL